VNEIFPQKIATDRRFGVAVEAFRHDLNIPKCLEELRSIVYFGALMAMMTVPILKEQEALHAHFAQSSFAFVALVFMSKRFFGVKIAKKMHFSAELGAFFAGSVFSRSVIAHQIEEVTESLWNIFCALFFVAIGTLIDPIKISKNWVATLFIILLATTAQIFVCWFGLYLSGEASKTSFANT
jgi:Kef-type K+ transport system membrane component KefB